MKYAIIFLIVAALGSLLGWRVHQNLKGDAGPVVRPQRAVPVEAAAIEAQTIKRIGYFTGTIEPRSQFVVAPKIAGRLDKLRLDIGDTVRRGDLVSVLDDDEYQQQVEQARAELMVAGANIDEANATLEVARNEYERSIALRERQIVSEAELEAADSQYRAQQARRKVTVAQVAQREAALRAAEVRLSYTQIHVDWEDGSEERIVGERYVDVGTMLRANDPIVSVLDINQLRGIISVTERDYPLVQVGQPVRITTDAFPGRVFMGTVGRIAPMVREASRQARVEVAIPNDDLLLKPGMFIRAEIEFETRENVPVISTASIIRRNGTQGIFLVDTNQRPMKARFHDVKTGITARDRVELMDAELLGSLIVTLGHHLLEDGTSIIVPDLRLDEIGSEPALLIQQPEESEGDQQ